MFIKNLLHRNKDKSSSGQSSDKTKMAPHATVAFNGKVFAEADSWETVEGNIYVSSPVISTGDVHADCESSRLRKGNLGLSSRVHADFSTVPSTRLF